jgi:hypothetical protein
VNLRIEGNLSELRQLYQVLSTRYDLSASKLYSNAMSGEDRATIKKKIPPFPASEITDEMIQRHGERVFRLYISNVIVGNRDNI